MKTTIFIPTADGKRERVEVHHDGKGFKPFLDENDVLHVHEFCFVGDVVKLVADLAEPLFLGPPHPSHDRRGRITGNSYPRKPRKRAGGGR
jgi:hypothetical protein